jgi:tRNA pseudouridine65 synthase
MTRNKTGLALPVLYLDENVVVVNKPSGLLVHRSGLDRGATEFALQTVRDQLGRHVYPVHRLDRATSGALVMALDAASARIMSEQFAALRVEKTYKAIVRGTPQAQFIVDHPLKEELDRMTDRLARKDKPAQTAVTEFTTLAQIEFSEPVDKFPTARYSLVQARPKTGRKHQIRRHSAHAGHPIVGDVTHGSGKHNRFFRQRFNLQRLLLACVEIGFAHPVSGRALSIKAPLAEDFAGLLRELDWGVHA